MFSVLVPIMMEFFKYQSGQVIREKFQMTQEQIQKTVQEQITKILIKFFGGLICTVTLCYSLIGLLDLFQSYINTLAYATEIKIVFFVIVLTSAVLGLKTIFVDKKLNFTFVQFGSICPAESFTVLVFIDMSAVADLLQFAKGFCDDIVLFEELFVVFNSADFEFPQELSAITDKVLIIICLAKFNFC